MKKWMTTLLSLCLLLVLLPCRTWAADESRSYDFRLTVNGSQQAEARPGDVVTVSLSLAQTDGGAPGEMYAMQAELEYDDTFFEFVDSSVMTISGIEWQEMGRRTGGRVVYFNYLSLIGGQEWPENTMIGSFQLKVIAESGISGVHPVNCLVSTEDGQDAFASTDNEVYVALSSDCVVRFVSNGGSEVPDQRVPFGGKIQRPEDPARDGYTFDAWYRNLDRTQPWDFENDTVSENMTLYAGWTIGSPAQGGGWLWWLLGALAAAAVVVVLVLLLGKKRVSFDTCGGTELDSVSVRRGKKICPPMVPVKPGMMFTGWYRDPEYTKPWNFDVDAVEKSMTLYACWR